MRRRVIAAAGAAVCAAVCGAGPAGASTTTWEFQAVPTPSGTSTATLYSVSCPARGTCVAVGLDDDRPAGTENGLAEYWDGTSWAVQTVPGPAGYLSGVSCPSATECMAVSGVGALADYWNGTSWTSQAMPVPAGGYGAGLDADACASPVSCTAVGLYLKDRKALPLAEYWDGTSWAVQRVPLPAGAATATLTGVSCPSATDCTVVGGYIADGTSGGAVPFAGHHGKAWSIQAMPSPAGATAVLLDGVSCTSLTACTAVGWFNSGSGGGPLVERWDGTSWTIQTDASPAGTTLEGVACTSSRSCTAVGGDGSSTGVAEHWDGTGWALQATPVPHKHTTAALLRAVSCLSASYCTAVGDYNGRRPLADHERA